MPLSVAKRQGIQLKALAFGQRQAVAESSPPLRQTTAFLRPIIDPRRKRIKLGKGRVTLKSRSGTVPVGPGSSQTSILHTGATATSYAFWRSKLPGPPRAGRPNVPSDLLYRDHSLRDRGCWQRPITLTFLTRLHSPFSQVSRSQGIAPMGQAPGGVAPRPSLGDGRWASWRYALPRCC